MAELKLYIPLIVRINGKGEAWNSLDELKEEPGVFHTFTINEAIRESMEKYGGNGLVNTIHGPLSEKVISAIPGVEESNGELYGTMTFTADGEFSKRDVGLLEFWSYEEFETRWGLEFERNPIEVEDGEIYVCFSNDIYDNSFETEEEFFGRNPPEPDEHIVFSCNEAELIATYEEVYQIPEESKITRWWGDGHMYEFKEKVNEDEIREVLEKSLKAVGMTKEEFNGYRYTYRQNLINKMEENMPEKYQVITLFNKPVLMSEGRVDAQNVPPDYYAYELRHDEGGDIAALEKSVRVDFGGTILSKDEIEIVGDHRKIDYDDYNFLSIDYSVEEFDEHYDELVDEYCEPEIESGMSMG